MSWAWSSSAQQQRRRRHEALARDVELTDWDGIDASIQLEALGREPFEQPVIELKNPIEPLLLKGGRMALLTPPWALELPPAVRPAAALPASGLLDEAPTAQELEVAAAALLEESPWFRMEAGPEPKPGDAHWELARAGAYADRSSRGAPSAFVQGALDARSSSSSIAPVAWEQSEESGDAVPMLFAWSRVAAAAAGVVAASLLLLVGLSWSSPGTLPGTSALGQVPAAVRVAPVKAALAASPRRAEGVMRAAFAPQRDPQSLGEAAVDKLVARASRVCSLGSVAPGSLTIEVIFKPSGQVHSASVSAAGGKSASATECLQAMVSDARIPQFDGDMVGVVRTLRVE